MFDGFSGQARRAMQLAYRAAHRFQHDYVGGDHILLGVVREESGDVLQLLSSFEIDRNALLQDLEAAMAPGETPVSSEQLPLTPLAKQVIERARRESEILYHEHVGPAHLLLALLHTNQGLAVNVLRQFNLDYMRVWECMQKQAPPINRDYQVQSDAKLAERILRDPSHADLQEGLTGKPLPDEMIVEVEDSSQPLDRLLWNPPENPSRDTLYRQLRYTQCILGMSVGFLGGYLAYGILGGAVGILVVATLLAVQNTVFSLTVGFAGGFAVGFFHTRDPLGTVIGAMAGILVGGCVGTLWRSRKTMNDDQPSEQVKKNST